MTWKKTNFSITVVVPLTGEISETLQSGIANETFGIFSQYGFIGDNSKWNLTHLGTGFRVTSTRTQKGAKEVAEYLTSAYRKQFDKLKRVGLNVKFYGLNTTLKEDKTYQALVRQHMP